MIDLTHEPYATYYHANKMSTTFLFCLAIYIQIVIVPFLIGFTTNDFWIRASTYYEQPTIKSLNQYLMIVQTADGSYFYTNIPEILKQRSNSQLMPQVQMSQQSDNTGSEELPKAQNFTVKVKLQQDPQAVRFVQILLFYEYALTANVNLKMQSFGEISLQSAVGINQATVVGSLQLSQRHPIYAGDQVRDRYNYPAYYDQDGALLQDQIQIIEANLQRNESISIRSHNLIMPALRSGIQSDITIILSVPKNQEVIYIATLLETLKFAWVQYLSIFIIFWFFGQFLLSFVIENKVFPSFKVDDLPYPVVSYTKKKLN